MLRPWSPGRCSGARRTEPLEASESLGEGSPLAHLLVVLPNPTTVLLKPLRFLFLPQSFSYRFFQTIRSLWLYDPGNLYSTYWRRGISRLLSNRGIAALLSEDAAVSSITVNASPYSVRVYDRLGFEATNELREKDGIKFVPMEKRLE